MRWAEKNFDIACRAQCKKCQLNSGSCRHTGGDGQNLKSSGYRLTTIPKCVRLSSTVMRLAREPAAAAARVKRLHAQCMLDDGHAIAMPRRATSSSVVHGVAAGRAISSVFGGVLK